MANVLITIPAYNEEKTISKVVTELHVAMKLNHVQDYEIVVVSDGSTDRTEDRACKAGATVIVKPHGGLADTFRAEMAHALKVNPKVIIHTDADGQYSAFDIWKLLAKAGDYDLVLGNRPAGHIEYMPWTKRVLNFSGSVFFSLVVGKRIGDFTTGLRAFNTKVAALPIYSDHTYTVEQIMKVCKAGLTVGSVPITFLKREGNSRLIPSSRHYLWRTIKNMRGMMRYENITDKPTDDA